MNTLKNATLANHFLFKEVMSDADICRRFLCELLNKNIVKISFINKEADLKDDWLSRGTRLDILAVDSNNVKYDIELQNINSKDLLKRGRYYQSSIDRRSLKPGDSFSDLPESYVIFICSFDFFNKSLARYDKICFVSGFTDMPYDDGANVIFLNSKYTIANVSKAVEEFLMLIENAAEFPMATKLGGDISAKIADIKSDSEKEAAFMTIEQYVHDLYGEDFKRARYEGEAIGIEKGEAIGIEKGEAKAKVEILKNLGITEAEYQEIIMRRTLNTTV